MPKDRNPRRAPLHPADVIAGRARPDARELIGLIRDVNPTGLDLDPRETARRYAQKSRLQSVLIARFRDAIDVRAEPAEPGVVSLRHRPSGLDACHAVIAELDDDARSWIQHLVDIEASEAHAQKPPEAPPQPRAHPVGKGAAVSSRAAEPALSADDLLREGRDAVLAYDYELARSRFEGALERSGGAAEPAVELLALLVETLGLDDDALAAEGRLSPAALGEPAVAVLLAVAAARRSERERALRLLKDGRARGYPPGRVADAFLALARTALAAGQLDDAAQDIAQAREHDPAHHDLTALSAALAKARASAREPAEVELSQVFAAGDLARAEERARALLARWPDSDAGRRITRAIEEQRRRDEAAGLFASARQALARGDMTEELALLGRALVGGLAGEDAASAERRIAAIEQEGRARDEQARLEEIRRALAAGDLVQGLPAFAALDAQKRRALAEPLGSPALLWLDQLAPPGAAAKAKAAIAAVLALRRAHELAGREPAAALDLLRAHEKVLAGFGPADELQRLVRDALAAQRRRAAQERLLAARRALAEGDPSRARDLLDDVQPEDVPDGEATTTEDLRARIRRALERRALTASLEHLRQEGDSLRALGVVGELLARFEEDNKSHLEALREGLRADVVQKFCVRIEDLPEGAEPEHHALHDAGLAPKEVWSTLLPDKRSPSGQALIVAQTRSDWVFLRLIDVAGARTLTSVTLRTPAPIDLLTAALRDRRLILAGRFGALLEVNTDDWSIVRFFPNVLGNDKAVREPLFAESPVPGMPLVVIEEMTVSPDGRFLWLNTLSGRSDSGRRVLHVLDLDSMRIIRAISVSRREVVHQGCIAGLPAPRMVVSAHTREEDEKDGDSNLTIYDARGVPAGWDVCTLEVLHETVVACPGGERVLAVTSDPDGSRDPRASRWGWVELGPRGASPLRLFEGVTAVYDATAVTSLETAMVFVLFETEPTGCELFGLRAGDGQLEIAYHVPLPRSSMLLASPDARFAALFMAHEERYEIAALGAEPPAVAPRSVTPRFHLPHVFQSTVNTKSFTCHRPTGARLAAATALRDKLKREPKHTLMRRLRLACKSAGVDELLTLEEALLQCHEPKLAGEVGLRVAWARFQGDARVRLLHAKVLADAGLFKDAFDLVSSVDEARLDEPGVKHFHHLRGLLLLRLDEPEAALAELRRAASFKEGDCNLGDGIALCTPLAGVDHQAGAAEHADTDSPWTPAQARLRALMTLIAAADGALGRGDAASARRTLDCPLVWDAYEVQSFARLAEAYLREDEAGGACDRFRMALALLSFCDLTDRMGTYLRRAMLLPRATWSAERLASLAARARAWADAALARS